MDRASVQASRRRNRRGARRVHYRGSSSVLPTLESSRGSSYILPVRSCSSVEPLEISSRLLSSRPCDSSSSESDTRTSPSSTSPSSPSSEESRRPSLPRLPSEIFVDSVFSLISFVHSLLPPSSFFPSSSSMKLTLSSSVSDRLPMREGARAVNYGQGLDVLSRFASSGHGSSQRPVDLPRSSPPSRTGTHHLPSDEVEPFVDRRRRQRKGEGTELDD